MNIGQRVLRMVSKQDEDYRVRLRFTTARSAAHSEELKRTIEHKKDELTVALKKAFSQQ